MPDVWPHVGRLLTCAGFGDGRREDVLAVAIADLPRAVPPPWPLLSTAADWLELAGVRLLLTYLDPTTDDAERAFVTAAGFWPMVTTSRVLQRRTSPGQTLARPG